MLMVRRCRRVCVCAAAFAVVLFSAIPTAANAVELQLRPAAVLYDGATGFDLSAGARIDLAAASEALAGFEAGIAGGYSTVSVDGIATNAGMVGATLSYRFSAFEPWYLRVGTLLGGQFAGFSGADINSGSGFLAHPSVEVGYEVLPNLTLGADLGLKIVVYSNGNDGAERSVPLGLTVGWRLL